MSITSTQQPMNYARQILTQFAEIDARQPRWYLDDETRLYIRTICNLIRASEKFILPNGGLLLEDPDLRGLEDDPLRLPYPVVCLEYSMAGYPYSRGDVITTKRVVVCSEEQDFISLKPVVFIDDRRLWVPMPEMKIPKVGWVDRNVRSPEGWPAITCFFAHDQIDPHDYDDEGKATIGLLNALACSNVTTERTPVKSAKLKPGALPFDSYHYLVLRNRQETVGSGRAGIGAARSPREHLRRGHIRRLHNGSKTWVNATVVNAGKPGGAVRKSYVVHA